LVTGRAVSEQRVVVDQQVVVKRRYRVANAVAQGKARGNGLVSVCGPNIAQQCLNLGLPDEVRINLVPVLLGPHSTELGRHTPMPRVGRRRSTCQCTLMPLPGGIPALLYAVVHATSNFDASNGVPTSYR
jgi:riboflavin biosynthesis pyrimidine reductase